MAQMFAKIVVLCIIGVAVTQVACDVQVKSLDVDNKSNDYFGDIVTDVKPQGDDSSISVTVPIKQDLDENLQMKINLNFNDIPILKDHVVSLCDAIGADGFLKPIVSVIEPAGKFPTKCPIPAGEWKVSNYVIDMKDYLPFGLTPSGDFDLQLDVEMPDQDPIVRAKVTGSVASSGALSSLLKLI